MKKNEVNKQIKRVCFWVFSFFFWFLVVGFFLKSEYPIYKYEFNPKDAYEVITDGLSLSAYFLAPAIAYVLFTDWRIQYKAIKEDDFYGEVEFSLNKLKYQCNDIFWDVAARSIDPENIKEQLSKKLQNLSVDFKELKIKFEKSKPDINNDNKIFLSSAEDAIKLFENIYTQLIFVQADFLILCRNEVEDQSIVKAKNISFTLNKKELSKNLEDIEKKLNYLGESKPLL